MNKFNGACLSFLVCAGLLFFSCSDFYNDLKNSGAQVVTPATSPAPTQTPATDPEPAPTPTSTPSPSSAASGAYTKIGTQTINGVEYDIVTFGSWPQTIKAANVEVDERCESKTVGDFTYYKGSDGQWYVHILENGHKKEWNWEHDPKYSDGSDVKDSSYNSYRWFKVEPIKWRVLTDNYSGKRLLLAENILVNNTYAQSSNNYANSGIRWYLNVKFWNTAFTDSEKSMIDETDVDMGHERLCLRHHKGQDFPPERKGSHDIGIRICGVQCIWNRKFKNPHGD